MDPHAAPADAQAPPVVLLVDDDPDTLDMYSIYFEMSGMSVATSRTASDAVSRVLELRPDLVVTDLGFGGKADGAPLVETLKGRPETRNVPVIVLTGQSTEHVPAAVREAADLCLVKPVLPDALLLDVERLIALSRALSDRCQKAVVQAAQLTARAKDLTGQAEALTGPVSLSRTCPQCGSQLEWLSREQVGGSIYDSYRCGREGCGLFSWDATASGWVKLV